MILETDNLPYRKLFAANVLATVQPAALIPATVAPTGDGVFLPGRSTNGPVCNQALFAFYGKGGNNTDLSAKIWGWRPLWASDNDPSSVLWIPRPLLELTITLGAQTGIANGQIVATEFFADTIAVKTGKDYTKNYTVEQAGTPDDTVALLAVDFAGAFRLQVQLWRGTATEVNALGSGY